MTDERNIGHDRKVEKRRKHADDIAKVPRAGEKPPQIRGGNEPSRKIAADLSRHGDAPNDRSHDVRENPDEGAKPHRDGKH
jgi:hypothetical protein